MILHQIFIHVSSAHLIKQALPRHRKYGKSLMQNFGELWQILVDCNKEEVGGEIVCILDALDECQDDSRKRLIDQHSMRCGIQRRSSGAETMIMVGEAA